MKLLLLTTVVLAAAATTMAAKLDGLGGGGGRNFIDIISDDRQGPLGAVYRTAFETENGIRVEEEGAPGSVGQAVIRGSYSYTSPEGQLITVTYIADENGFQPQGAHLPTPPPMPLHALKQIEFAAQQARNRNK